MKKIFAVILSLVLLLTFSLTALAVDRNQSQTPNLDKQIQRLQELKQKQAQAQPIKDQIKIIRELQRQTEELRQQISAANKELRPLLQQARQSKNIDALILALTDLKQVKADLANIKSIADQNDVLWKQFQSLRENKDFDGALAALKQIEAGVKSKLDAHKKAKDSLDKTIADLKAALAKQPTQ